MKKSPDEARAEWQQCLKVIKKDVLKKDKTDRKLMDIKRSIVYKRK